MGYAIIVQPLQGVLSFKSLGNAGFVDSAAAIKCDSYRLESLLAVYSQVFDV